MEEKKKQIIGIAGGSAGGKSTFCGELEGALEKYRVRVIHMDSFFKPESERPYVPSHLNGKSYIDDNCPDTIDWEKYHAAFDEALSSDADVIILEGLLVLWDKYTFDKLTMKIFVDCRSDERIVRRIRRNMTWGQTFDGITDVYLNMVRFRHDEYVEPTKWCADFIVNGSGNTELIRDMCADRVVKSLMKK